MKHDLLVRLRKGDNLSFRQQLMLIVQLSMPAIMAQISTIIMQYIDASMVGRLGSSESASIGLVTSSTWLFGSVLSAVTTGFTVQTAQSIGAGAEKTARQIMKQGLVISAAFGLLLCIVGASISGILPVALGGGTDICKDASNYFLVYALSLPIIQISGFCGGMLQASGNMKVPSVLNILACGLDVIFNMLLIFPSRYVFGIWIPGADLGVLGAALGTAFAQLVTAILMAVSLLIKSPALSLRKGEKFKFSKLYNKIALKIAIPIGIEQIITCGAYVAATGIVAPLGTVAIAANSFSVTAEGFCYMPGYGIAAAATTIIGQSIGAGRRDLTRKLGWLTTGLGMTIMTFTGAFLFCAAPFMLGLLTPDKEVIELGAEVLRIEAFAEPLFAAGIVAAGVFRGAGDTFIPSCMNFIGMWVVRIPLSAFLAPRIGLKGVWIAMCADLCVRGILFLIRLAGKNWHRKAFADKKEAVE